MISTVSSGSLPAKFGLARVKSHVPAGKRLPPGSPKNLTAFQNNCRTFLHGYAGYSYSQLNKLTGSQIAEGARLVCIRDGHKDWIGFVSDWIEGHQK